MPPREDLILFLDLETTGTDVPKDNIIEVGLSLICTEPGYPEVGSLSRTVAPGDEAYSRLVRKPVVFQMHKANGLLDEVTTIRNNEFAYGSYSIESVESDVLKWLKQYVGNDTTHIPLGGSGVLHFDRRFIKYFMPKFDQRLTHWAYDVGVMRRMFQKAGVRYASEDAKTHRALDDARVHADEFRWYQQFVTLNGEPDA